MSCVADELDGNRLTGARDWASHPTPASNRATSANSRVLHAVGLSLGCACELDVDHLGKLADLVNVSFSLILGVERKWGCRPSVHGLYPDEPRKRGFATR